jgi:NAD(P)-dependent dehydrogenase (short-subunit alcohol dehydrogenase family)
MLRKSEDARIVAMTSKAGGEEARAFWGAYAVSKAALEMLIETHAAETKNTNIRHAIIDPGAMRTDMRKVAMPGEDPETLPHPDEIVPLFFEAITRREREPLKLKRR